jgi:hypothetical protein
MFGAFGAQKLQRNGDVQKIGKGLDRFDVALLNLLQKSNRAPGRSRVIRWEREAPRADRSPALWFAGHEGERQGNARVCRS